MKIAQRLRMLREETGLNQKDFAKNIGMPYTTYNGYEIDKREPDIDTIKFFAKHFNVSVSYITGETDIKNPFTENAPNKDHQLFVDKIVNYLTDKGIIKEGEPISEEKLNEIIKVFDITYEVFLKSKNQ